MPLMDGDIVVTGIDQRTVKLPNGKMGPAEEITFTVRGGEPRKIYIPAEEYSKAFAEQMLMRAAADIIDLLDRFPDKG